MIWQHAILIYLPPNEHFTNGVTDMNLKSIESAISLLLCVFFQLQIVLTWLFVIRCTSHVFLHQGVPWHVHRLRH